MKRYRILYLIICLLASCCLFGCGAQQEAVEESVLPEEPVVALAPGFDVLFVSDSHIAADTTDGIFRNILTQGLAAGEDVRMVLHGGCMTVDAADEAAWAVFEQQIAVLGETPLYPAWGDTDHAQTQNKYFTLAHNGPADLPSQFYSFDEENAHFIMMDSSYMGLQNDSYVQWLRDDVAAAGKQWNILVMHHPLYPATEGETDQMRAEAQRAIWLAAIEEAGIDLVLCGHQHVYQRSEPLLQGVADADGIVYLMVSSGGAAPAGALLADGYGAMTRDDVSSYCLLHISETTIEITAFDQDGTEIDHFTLE